MAAMASRVGLAVEPGWNLHLKRSEGLKGEFCGIYKGATKII